MRAFLSHDDGTIMFEIFVFKPRKNLAQGIQIALQNLIDQYNLLSIDPILYSVEYKQISTLCSMNSQHGNSQYNPDINALPKRPRLATSIFRGLPHHLDLEIRRQAEFLLKYRGLLYDKKLIEE